MAMLGWSSGGMLAYAYAADETRYPAALRHVDALIPVDIVFKFSADHEEQRIAACQRFEAAKAALDAGQDHNSGEASRSELHGHSHPARDLRPRNLHEPNLGKNASAVVVSR